VRAFWHSNLVTPSNSATQYFAVGNQSQTTAGGSATESLRQVPISESITITKVWFNHTQAGAAASGKKWDVTLRKNAVATAATFNITEANPATGRNIQVWTGSISVTAGDLLSIETVPTATPTASQTFQFVIEYTITGQKFIMVGGTSGALGTNTTPQYQHPHQYTASAWTATANTYDMIMPAAGNITKLMTRITTAAGASKSRTTVLRLNNTTDYLSNATSGATDTLNSATGTVAVVAGDRVAIKTTAAGTPAAAQLAWSITIAPTNNGEIWWGAASLTTLSTSAEVFGTWGGANTPGNVLMNMPTDWGISFKNLYVRWSVAPGGATTRTFNLGMGPQYQNEIGTNLATSSQYAVINTTTTGAATTANETATVARLQGNAPITTQSVAFRSLPTGTPAAGAFNAGVVLVLPQLWAQEDRSATITGVYRPIKGNNLGRDSSIVVSSRLLNSTSSYVKFKFKAPSSVPVYQLSWNRAVGVGATSTWRAGLWDATETTLLASVNVSWQVTFSGWLRGILPTPYMLTAGTEYVIKIDYISGTVDASNYPAITTIDYGGDTNLPITMQEGSMDSGFGTAIDVVGYNDAITGTGRAGGVVGNAYYWIQSASGASGALWSQNVAFERDIPLHGVGFRLLKVGSPTYDIGWRIYDDTNTLLDSGILVNAATITATTPGTSELFRAALTTPITLDARRKYRFAVGAADGTSGTSGDRHGVAIWGVGFAGDYNYGSYDANTSSLGSSTNNGVSWGDVSNLTYDLWFETTMFGNSERGAAITGDSSGGVVSFREAKLKGGTDAVTSRSASIRGLDSVGDNRPARITGILPLPDGPFNWGKGVASGDVGAYTLNTTSTTVGPNLQFVAPYTMTIDTLSVYLSSLVGTQAVRKIGLYQSIADGGAELTSTTWTPSAAAWNNLSVPGYKVTAGTEYRIIVTYFSGVSDASNYITIAAITDITDTRNPVNMQNLGLTDLTGGNDWPAYLANNWIGTPYAAGLGGAIWAARERGETATFSKTLIAKTISFRFFKLGSPTFDIDYKIYDETNTLVRSGSLGNATLVTGTTAGAAVVLSATLSSPLTIPAGNQYRFMVAVNGGVAGDGSNYVAAAGYSTTTNVPYTDKSVGTYGGDSASFTSSADSGATFSQTIYADIFWDMALVESSDRSAVITGLGGGTANDFRAAKLTGKDTSSSNRSATVAGRDTSNSARSATIAGKATTNAARSAVVTGRDSANSARPAVVTGKLTANDFRAARISGKDTINSVRPAVITGKSTANDARAARISGKDTSNSARPAVITGRDTSNSARAALLYGRDNVNSFRAAVITGAGGSSSVRPAVVSGIDTANNSRAAVIRGGVNVNDSRAAKLSGIDVNFSFRAAIIRGGSTAFDVRAAKLTGQLTDASARPAVIRGIATANDYRGARITGTLAVYDDRNAVVSGKATSNSARAAVVTGSISVNSSRSAVITGSLGANSSRAAIIYGRDTVNSFRPARITGVNGANDSRAAVVTGRALANDSRSAVLSGIAGANSYRDARITGTFVANDERQAVIAGRVLVNDFRAARVTGVYRSNSERAAVIRGRLTVFDYRGATIKGSYPKGERPIINTLQIYNFFVMVPEGVQIQITNEGPKISSAKYNSGVELILEDKPRFK